MVNLIKGINDLATCNPQLASEWHPTKNENLTPQDVTCGSGKKVWWYLPYDTEDGRHFNFEWQAKIYHRNNGIGCPFLSNFGANIQIWKGFNDLASCNPQLAKEWHPTKNGNLTPDNICANSNKKVWWLLPYDTEDGKHFDFEWQATVNERNNGASCPYLNGKRIWIGFNDLTTTNPELASEWHPTKNGNLTPQDVTCNSNKKVWWLLPYDTKDGKHFDFEWQASIAARNNGTNCPYLTNSKLYKGFNDLETMNPQLAKEWHPTKNGNLKPSDVIVNSIKNVWWLVSYDTKDGKHFDFEWQAKVIDRNLNPNCPFLSNARIWKGFNDLATINPQLANEWHPTKNGSLKASDVTCGSDKKVWWKLSYKNPKTNKIIDFEWQARISHRNNGASCPFISASNPEILMYDILRELKVDFEAEKTFSNCKNKKELPFDIYIPSKNLLIEFDGEQHFKHISFFGEKDVFETRIINDNIKNNFCKENDISLLRIPYIYSNREDIKKIIIEMLKTNKVSNDILSFYSQFEFSNYS